MINLQKNGRICGRCNELAVVSTPMNHYGRRCSDSEAVAIETSMALEDLFSPGKFRSGAGEALFSLNLGVDAALAAFFFGASPAAGALEVAPLAG